MNNMKNRLTIKNNQRHKFSNSNFEVLFWDIQKQKQHKVTFL